MLLLREACAGVGETQAMAHAVEQRAQCTKLATHGDAEATRGVPERFEAGVAIRYDQLRRT